MHLRTVDVDDQAQLEHTVDQFVAQGYTLAHRDTHSATMTRRTMPLSIRRGLLAAFFLPAYLVYRELRDRVVLIRITPETV